MTETTTRVEADVNGAAMEELGAAVWEAGLYLAPAEPGLPFGEVRAVRDWRAVEPGPLDVASVAEWVAAEGVAASVSVDGAARVVMVPQNPDGVRELAAALRRSRAVVAAELAVRREPAEVLGRALAGAEVGAEVESKRDGSVLVTFSASQWEEGEVCGAVEAARLLGGSSAVAGLDLERRSHRKKLARRLVWMLAAAVGPLIDWQHAEECDHRDSSVWFVLTPEQARRFAVRLTAA